MNKQDLLKAITTAKARSKERNFTQSVDVIVSFKDLNLKQANQQFEIFVRLPHPTEKNKKICCLLGPEFAAQKEVCDHFIDVETINTLNKKDIKKLAKEYDFFVTQGNFMATIAKTLGRYLGPRNKMPNPKAGCIIAPGANLETTKKNLQSTTRIGVKTVPLFQCRVGSQETKEEHIVENILTLYNQIIHHAPKEVHNIKDIFVKTTMGPAVKVGAIEEPTKKTPKEETKTETAEKQATEKPANAEGVA